MLSLCVEYCMYFISNNLSINTPIIAVNISHPAATLRILYYLKFLHTFKTFVSKSSV